MEVVLRYWCSLYTLTFGHWLWSNTKMLIYSFCLWITHSIGLQSVSLFIICFISVHKESQSICLKDSYSESVIVWAKRKRISQIFSGFHHLSYNSLSLLNMYVKLVHEDCSKVFLELIWKNYLRVWNYLINIYLFT